MKILEKVHKIINEYHLKPIELADNYRNAYDLIHDFPDEKNKYVTEKTDDVLFEKYKKFIPIGWYGFSIGSPIIPEWIEIIDKILQLCVEADPDFEIHQIKIKYGGICFYTQSRIIEDLFEVEMLIENTLFDKALIY